MIPLGTAGPRGSLQSAGAKEGAGVTEQDRRSAMKHRVRITNGFLQAVIIRDEGDEGRGESFGRAKFKGDAERIRSEGGRGKDKQGVEHTPSLH